MQEPLFRALHISDLHFSDEPRSFSDFREEIKKNLIDNHIESADCLIISGDIFSKGTLGKNSDEVERKFEEFIEELPGKDYIIVVPGNHDLDRLAQKRSKSYNQYISRRKIVNSFAAEILKKDGREFQPSPDECEVLYREAFGEFCSFSKKHNFKSFNQDCTDCPLTPEKFELQVVEYKRFDAPFVRFVLLNTALIAGQTIELTEYQEKQKKLSKEYQSLLGDDPAKAAEKLVEIYAHQRSFEKHGELIVDGELKGTPLHGEQKDTWAHSDTGHITSVYGRMSLSKGGHDVLTNLGKGESETLLKLGATNKKIPTFFVGHHGYQFLSHETQRILIKTMDSLNSRLYLCGHAHQVKSERFHITNNSIYGREARQFQAGAIFKDKKGYAQFGFNLIEISESFHCTVKTYFLIKTPFGDMVCYEEKDNEPLLLPTPESWTGTKGLSDSEKKTNPSKIENNIIEEN